MPLAAGGVVGGGARGRGGGAAAAAVGDTGAHARGEQSEALPCEPFVVREIGRACQPSSVRPKRREAVKKRLGVESAESSASGRRWAAEAAASFPRGTGNEFLNELRAREGEQEGGRHREREEDGVAHGDGRGEAHRLDRAHLSTKGE